MSNDLTYSIAADRPMLFSLIVIEYQYLKSSISTVNIHNRIHLLHFFEQIIVTTICGNIVEQN